MWLLSPTKTGTGAGVGLQEAQIPYLGNRASSVGYSRKPGFRYEFFSETHSAEGSNLPHKLSGG